MSDEKLLAVLETAVKVGAYDKNKVVNYIDLIDWSTETPTEDGYYWVKYRSGDNEILNIYDGYAYSYDDTVEFNIEVLLRNGCKFRPAF